MWSFYISRFTFYEFINILICLNLLPFTFHLLLNDGLNLLPFTFYLLLLKSYQGSKVPEPQPQTQTQNL